MLLDASGGRINSKTKLQKEIYFISLLLKMDLGFKAHFYGPYSPEVEQSTDELVGAGFVNTNREIFGQDTNRGFEFKRYNFSLMESGKELTKMLKKEHHKEYKKILRFIEQLQEIGNPDYLSLSLAAKAHFILTEEGNAMTNEQIKEKAEKFNWNVHENDINIAVNILKELNFAEEA